jgi:phosphate starvation-inducible PhoH-like protein
VLTSLFANDSGCEAARIGAEVRVTTREGWLRVEGEPERIEQTRRVFNQLERARQNGVTIRRHEFLYALRSVAGNEAETGLDELSDTRILCSSKRPPIIPKTAGQRAYIHAIRNCDMVFGVGPAGTGKTYLAMALAVAALKAEEVTRIILTRPAVEAGEALGFLPGDLNEKIMPYLRPLYDALHDMLDPRIPRCPRAHRGRTPRLHARPYAQPCVRRPDEAQNTTTEQMFMFHATRRGLKSRDHGRPHADRFAGEQTSVDRGLRAARRGGNRLPFRRS